MKIFFLIVIALGLSACDRAEKAETTSLTLNLPDLTASTTTALSDMNCFGVFVSGPEKDMQKYGCGYTTKTAGNGGGFGYGTFLGGFYNDGTLSGSQLTIEAPNGSDRILRLVGAKIDTAGMSAVKISSRTACEEGFKIHPVYRKFFDPLYIISESKPLQMKGEDLAVNMTASFDTNNEISFCTGLGVESTAGIPTKIAVIVQDPPSSFVPKVVSYADCVGVKFQVQDSSGKPATLTSAIDAEILETVSSLSIGTFYYPVATPGVDVCGAVNQVPVLNGKIPLAFYSGAQYFNDIVLFFRPNPTGSALRTISVDASSLKGGSLNLTYTNGARSPSKYALYDLFNNVSTLSSTTTTPATVRKDECRLAALEFLDQYSTPFQLTATASPPDNIRIRTVPSGALQFYQNQANCTAGVGSSSDFTIGVAASSSATGYGFFYKVAAGSSGTFSFAVENKGDTVYPVIGGGDVTASSNLWQIAN